jgi:AmiR/NasT family two-component response regulator
MEITNGVRSQMKPSIVIVEDESILRMDLKEMIEEAGYRVIGEAGDGEKAIELAHQLKPDLIIMDIKMPKLNGLKASEIISKSLQLPILLLTAYSQRDFVQKAKQANIVGYLVKPITEANLIPAIEIALAQAQRITKYKQDIGSLHKRLEVRKLVEKAKGVLMSQQNLSEESAYQTMRKKSMKKQVSMEQMAHTILMGQED